MVAVSLTRCPWDLSPTAVTSAFVISISGFGSFRCVLLMRSKYSASRPSCRHNHGGLTGNDLGGFLAAKTNPVRLEPLDLVREGWNVIRKPPIVGLRGLLGEIGRPPPVKGELVIPFRRQAPGHRSCIASSPHLVA
jgi:hypothetical protein